MASRFAGIRCCSTLSTTSSAHLGSGVLEIVQDDALLRLMGKTSKTEHGKGHDYSDDVLSKEKI